VVTIIGNRYLKFTKWYNCVSYVHTISRTVNLYPREAKRQWILLFPFAVSSLPAHAQQIISFWASVGQIVSLPADSLSVRKIYHSICACPARNEHASPRRCGKSADVADVLRKHTKHFSCPPAPVPSYGRCLGCQDNNNNNNSSSSSSSNSLQ